MGYDERDVVWVAPGFPLQGDPFAAVREMTGEVYRDVPGRRTLRFERDGRGYFLKYHKGVGWGEIFKNLIALRAPIISAENEWRAIERLEQAGVPTMKTTAYGIRGSNPAAVESFIITEELAPTESLEDWTCDWEEKPPSTTEKRRIIAEVARMTRDMHRAGVNHRDLYICHFLLNTQSLERGEVRLSLIDLHRAQIRRQVPLRWRNKDLASLYFSSMQADLSQRDLLRFLRVYFDEPLRIALDRERGSLRWLRREGERLRLKFLRKYA